MTNSTEQTSTAASTKKRDRNDSEETEDPVNFLSQTRKEAKLSKQSRQKDSSEPNQASLKMAKRLEPIEALLATLPKPLAKLTSDYATTLLSHAIEVRHCERKVNYHNENPAILPSPIRFKYKLACKPEYEDTSEFKTQATLSSNIMHKCKQDLRVCMIAVMEMELSGAINKHQKTFVEGLLELFSYWICYLKACDPENCPPFSNDKGAEVLLQMFFKGAPSEIFEYLHSDKDSFLKKIIIPRADSIKYIHDEDLTE